MQHAHRDDTVIQAVTCKINANNFQWNLFCSAQCIHEIAIKRNDDAWKTSFRCLKPQFSLSNNHIFAFGCGGEEEEKRPNITSKYMYLDRQTVKVNDKLLLICQNINRREMKLLQTSPLRCTNHFGTEYETSVKVYIPHFNLSLIQSVTFLGMSFIFSFSSPVGG